MMGGGKQEQGQSETHCNDVCVMQRNASLLGMGQSALSGLTKTLTSFHVDL